MDLKYLNKDELRGWWHFIKEGLEKVRAKGHNTWISEDIYCDCYEQRSFLYVGLRDGKPLGFTVLQPIGKTLHVWVAYMENHTHDDFLIGWKHIQNIANNANMDKVSFSSVRKGWTRHAKEMGFKPATWEYTL
jgi:hypothetical protein